MPVTSQIAVHHGPSRRRRQTRAAPLRPRPRPRGCRRCLRRRKSRRWRRAAVRGSGRARRQARRPDRFAAQWRPPRPATQPARRASPNDEQLRLEAVAERRKQIALEHAPRRGRCAGGRRRPPRACSATHRRESARPRRRGLRGGRMMIGRQRKNTSSAIESDPQRGQRRAARDRQRDRWPAIRQVGEARDRRGHGERQPPGDRRREVQLYLPVGQGFEIAVDLLLVARGRAGRRRPRRAGRATGVASSACESDDEARSSA